MKTCFVIGSCIYTNSINKGVYTNEERISQTLDTIKSIRKNAPDSDILLVDNGIVDPRDSIAEFVDIYIYCGNNPSVRKASDGKNKGLGEAEEMRVAAKALKKYDYFFKISGRYLLADEFEYSMYTNFKGATFYNLTMPYERIRGKDYVKGSYSTCLYGVDLRYLLNYRLAMLLTIVSLRILPPSYSYELIMPFLLHLCGVPFSYVRFEPCEGLMASGGRMNHGEIKDDSVRN